MNKVIVQSMDASSTLSLVGSILESGFIPNEAQIHFSLRNGRPPLHQQDSYPLILKGELEQIPTYVYVYGVAIGHIGVLPHVLFSILKACDFEFDEMDIWSTRLANPNSGWVDHTYRK